MKKYLLAAAIVLGLVSCRPDSAVQTQDEPDHTVRLIRSATLKMDYGDKTILLDPMLGEKGTMMSALGVNLNPRVHFTMPVHEVLDGVDLVLLTHVHIDHCQTTRDILRNESIFNKVDMNHLIIPEDGETINL